MASVKLGNAKQYHATQLNINEINHDHKTSVHEMSKLPSRARITCCDRFMTLLGVERAWMDSKSIANYNLYNNEHSALKIYEIGLESISTMILQICVALVIQFSDNYDPNEDSMITLVASIGITIVSISYSIFRLFDKHSWSQETNLILAHKIWIVMKNLNHNSYHLQ